MQKNQAGAQTEMSSVTSAGASWTRGALLIGAVGVVSLLLPIPGAHAQTPNEVRLRIRCVSDAGGPDVTGRIASFVWTRGGVPTDIVTPGTAFRCDTTAVVANVAEVAADARTQVIAVPDNATGFSYRVIAADPAVADVADARAGRAVCNGDVNFRNSPDPMTSGELPSYLVKL